MDSILIILEAMIRMFIFFGSSVLIGFVSFMLIQLISYRLFNFNIYQKIMRKLFN